MQTTGISVRLWPLLGGTLVVLGLTASPAAAASDRLHRLIELKAEDGAGATKAYALNNTGQVIGWMDSGGERHSAYWHVETSTDLHGVVHFDLRHPYDLYSLSYSESYDISNAGQIVGTGRTEIDCPPAVLITNAFVLRPAVLTDLATPYPGDALTNLGTLGPPCEAQAWDSSATGISNRNHVVGWADTPDDVTHAFLVTPVDGLFSIDTDPNGVGDGVNDLLIDLGTLPPADADPVSAATGVNDAGCVTGYSYTITASQQAAYHAFLIVPADNDGDGVGDTWFTGNNGVNDLMTDIGTLGGTNSWGRDINAGGRIVGESDYDAGPGQHYTRAFSWKDGVITNLGTLGGNFSAASAINDDDVIVGWAENEDGQRRAFIYEDGEMTDLNDLLCNLTEEGLVAVPTMVLTEARGINEDGVICGWGTTRTGATRGFVLMPIDPNDCVAEEDDAAADSGSSSGGDGSAFEGNPITGTPGNLAAGSGSTANNDADDTQPPAATPAGLCGFGALSLTPLMFVGLLWRKAGCSRRLRRIG